MSEENKYYTPSIEEFYVGFEFESNYVLFSESLEWKKIIFGSNGRLMDDLPWFYSAYKHDASPLEFRAKYLDREDIESLGWKKDSGDCDYINNKDNQLEIYPTLYDGGLCLHITEDYGSCLLFHGTVKNKSELKSLLKKLNIGK